jgi:RimJ/RimL family protein N-acetyltransferase
MTASITRLRPADAAVLVAIRREALKREPHAFAATLADDPALSLEFVQTALADEDGQATFGAFDGDAVVGMVGVFREPNRRRDARLWGMYVAPEVRRRGIGRALLAAAIAHARTWQEVEELQLTVAPAAATRLYETVGFRRSNRERPALLADRRARDESHLALRLRLPSFSTRRLALAPATVDDAAALWAIWRDPDVRRYLFDDVAVTRERAVDVLEACLALLPAGLGLWTVGRREDGALIGCVGLQRVTGAAADDPRIARAVEPLAAFMPSVWGNGYAHEALAAVIGYGFESLGLAKMAAVTDVPNAASDRMVRRVGFRVVGECDGPKYRLRMYALTAAEFMAVKAPS